MDPYCVLTSSEERYVSLFKCWLILFVSKLFLTWNSKFLWKQTYMILQWDWCLLCDSGIKLVKFVFVSKLTLSLFKLLLPWIAKFLWKEPSMSPLLRTGVTEIGKFQLLEAYFFCLLEKLLRTQTFKNFV